MDKWLLLTVSFYETIASSMAGTVARKHAPRQARACCGLRARCSVIFWRTLPDCGPDVLSDSASGSAIVPFMAVLVEGDSRDSRELEFAYVVCV